LVKKVEKKKRNCNRPRYSSGEETLLSRFFYPSILLSLSLSLSLSQPVFFRRSRAGVEWATRGVFFARKASSTRGWAGEGGSRVAAVGAARATSCSITASTIQAAVTAAVAEEEEEDEEAEEEEGEEAVASCFDFAGFCDPYSDETSACADSI
jgi:hypothetical protein